MKQLLFSEQLLELLSEQGSAPTRVMLHYLFL